VAAVGAYTWAEDRRGQAARHALDTLVRTTAQATRRYRTDHGRYPETLREFVPRYLARVPAHLPDRVRRLAGRPDPVDTGARPDVR
jgi:type II secretory pathway pseudopilin PulG